MIALIESYRSGLFKAHQWIPNIMSGVIVGIVALPLAMAFAIASGVKPEQGLYTAIVAGIIVAIFGGSRVQIAGPTGAFIVILSGITSKYGIDGLQVATLMAGIMLVLFGIAKLGNLIKYIPSPVITGFTAGIAIIIFVGQWSYFLGLPGIRVDRFHENILNLLSQLPNFHPATTMLAIIGLIIVILGPRFMKVIPAPLIAMLAVTVLQTLFNFEGVATIGSVFGGIPSDLPHFSFLPFSKVNIMELIDPAFTIAMLSSIESLLAAVVADGMSGTKHSSNQELIGQGLANIITPLFGGFAATAGLARTATNIRNGGTSPIAGISHSLVLLIILVFLAPLAGYIPLCVLSAILFVVAYNMSDARHFLSMVRRAPRPDVFVLIITFLLTIFVDLVIAVNVGVILASLLFMRRMAKTVAIKRQDEQIAELPADTMVYSIDGPFFFGAAESFEQVLQHQHTNPKTLIIRLGGVPFMDITGLQTFGDVIIQFQKSGTRVILCEVHEQVLRKLEKADLIKKIGREWLFTDVESALRVLKESR